MTPILATRIRHVVRCPVRARSIEEAQGLLESVGLEELTLEERDGVVEAEFVVTAEVPECLLPATESWLSSSS